MEKRIKAPLTDEIVLSLHAGDKVIIDGPVLAARDAAHAKLVELLDKKENLPVDLQGQIIYYVGPTPARPGYVIGSAGPTTSSRMDKFAPLLIERGLKGMIGKGFRSQAVKDAIMKYKAVYFAATGGAGALISKRIIKQEIIAYEELGPEALRLMVVENFPVYVVNDAYGEDLYIQGQQKYAR
ncbi:MAG: fumarate hydratase [Candidatus Fischerbacteria bacterium RBG_13_37_8]|uniref:Fumarate hydratase n=1 Tax=Candidatus Fischerbacteria bacterium RBG_13_37_8 TaxID=1817863 RepID=A0A1F5VN76_9BACT|nr:MAG: fumarate hydratase [Candidatus Fischerbacteria bacterium RBG_13_37_8]